MRQLQLPKNLLVLLLVMFAFISRAQQVQNCEKKYIDVTGTAEIEVVPDRIYLQIVLNEATEKDKRSLSKLEGDLTDVLKKIGIPLTNLVVDDAASYFRKSIFSGKDIYARKTYELLIDNAATIGKVLEEFEKAGISNVTLKSVDHSKMAEFKKQVKVDAAKAAKEKAEYLLKAIGEQLGGALFITEIDNVYETPQYMNRVRGEISFSDSGNEDISFKKIKIKYSVNARFEIK